MAASLQQISEMIAARQRADAALALQKLVKKKSNTQADWHAAMRMAASLGDQDTALEAAEAWRAQAPNDPQRQVAVIDALGNVAKHEKAASLARKLQQSPTVAADGYYLEGVVQGRLGNRDEALRALRQALTLHPSHGPAWEQIALLGGHDDLTQDIAQMEALTKQLTAPALLIPLFYALGRAHDRADDIDRAFHYVSGGAALRQRLSPFNLQPLLGYLERLATTFTPQLIDQLRNDASDDNLIFILTAPRSGSTLTEQILATAPNIAPAGENTLLYHATLQLGSMEPPDMQKALTFKNSDWRKMAQSYLTAVRKRFGASKYYTDKSATNYYYAGLIRIMFPNAKLVWCKRDPRDIVWSCFRSHISANQWTQSLDDCARAILAQEKLCEHWKRIAGDDLIELPYEDLVTAPDETTSRLFAGLNQERPENWRDFYKDAGAVATASLAQVRQPLNDKAVGSWRRYEKHLAPIYDKYFQ